MFVSKQINHSFEATKKDLHKKGLSVSSTGVSVKTSGRMTREDYIDSTQRAFINGMAVMKQAGSFGHADDIERPSPSTDSPRGSPANSRQNSLADGGPMPSRKNSLPVGTHAKAPSLPQTNMGAFSRRSDSITGNGSPIASIFGGGRTVTPPSPEEKKKKLSGLFTMKRRDSGKRGSTPQPI